MPSILCFVNCRFEAVSFDVKFLHFSLSWVCLLYCLSTRILCQGQWHRQHLFHQNQALPLIFILVECIFCPLFPVLLFIYKMYVYTLYIYMYLRIWSVSQPCGCAGLALYKGPMWLLRYFIPMRFCYPVSPSDVWWCL